MIRAHFESLTSTEFVKALAKPDDYTPEAFRILVEVSNLRDEINRDADTKPDAELPTIRRRTGFVGFYFSVEGRVSRGDYWLKCLIPLFLLGIVPAFMDAAAGTVVFIPLYNLVVLLPFIAVNVKRCHDRGRSGWFLLLGQLPFLNLWVAVELLLLRGTRGSNKYGEDPAVERIQVV